MPEETTERKPFGGEHRVLTTADLDEIKEYVKPKSAPRKPSSKPKAKGGKSK